MMSALQSSPTLRAHTLIQQNITSIKGRLETARTEAVTGQVVDVGRAVNGNTAKVNLLSEAIAYADDRKNVLDFEGSRMSTAQATLTSLRDTAGDTVTALRFATQSSSDNTRELAESSALAGLEDTIGRLNGAFGGRPLFGGDSGNSPLGSAEDVLNAVRAIVASAPDAPTALTQIDTWFNDPAGGFETTFFQGGAGDAPTVELDKGERTATSVRADDEALRNMLRGFAVAAVAAETPSDADRDSFQQAGISILSETANGVLRLQASLGVGEERVAEAQAGHEAQVSTLSIAYNGLTGRDQAEAATEMKLLETQLEAAYLTTSRMANLSLINYM